MSLFLHHFMLFSFFFFFNDTATTEIYTLSLHDALPIRSGSLIVLLPRSLGFAWQAGLRPRGRPGRARWIPRSPRSLAHAPSRNPSHPRGLRSRRPRLLRDRGGSELLSRTAPREPPTWRTYPLPPVALLWPPTPRSIRIPQRPGTPALPWTVAPPDAPQPARRRRGLAPSRTPARTSFPPSLGTPSTDLPGWRRPRPW